MPLIKNPLRAYRNAREAFRTWNEWRKNRKERDMPDKEPTLRTSTKSGGAMGAGAAVMAVLAQMFPEAVGSMSPDTAIVLGAIINAAIGWVAARFSRTPAKPGKL